MPCCCLCLVDSYPPIHQFTDSSIQWIRYVSSIYNGPGPGTVGGTWYRRHSCLDMVPSLPQGILHSSRWDKMSMKTKFITHRMPWLCYSSICTMFLCFYKYSVLSGLGACTPIWEAWNRSVCQSGFTEATIGILDRKWFHTGNLKPPKPLEGWGSEGQRKKFKYRDCSEASGRFSGDAWCLRQNPAFAMCWCPGTCFQVYLECSSFLFSSAFPILL